MTQSATLLSWSLQEKSQQDCPVQTYPDMQGDLKHCVKVALNYLQDLKGEFSVWKICSGSSSVLGR